MWWDYYKGVSEKRTKPQTYKIKWDDGSTMNCEEQHVEQAIEEDSEDRGESDRGDAVDYGGTVVCGSDDDALRKTWTRIGD